CFGGSTCLQLAYAGTDVKAVVSFHGGLTPPEPAEAKAIKAKVLICHGALDKFIPEATLSNVRKAFDEAKVDYEMVYYGGAAHSFTVPDAAKAGMDGIAYNAPAEPAPAAPRGRRGRWPWLVALGVVLLVVAGGVAIWSRMHAPARAPGPAPEGMVWIPAGTFWMGSPVLNLKDARPEHEVTLDG